MSEITGFCICGAALSDRWYPLHRPGCPTRNPNWYARMQEMLRFDPTEEQRRLWHAYISNATPAEGVQP